MELIPVKPAKGRTVRDPETGLTLPPVCTYVPRNTFWTRRLRDGDVEPAKPAPAKKATKAAPKEN